jgi:hypothetical protein
MLLADTFDMGTFCTGSAGLLQFVGYILTIVKIAIPILIVAFGLLDFGKAVVGSKDDLIKKSAISLLRRVVAGIVIFFLPTLVLTIFDAISDYSNNKDDFDNCKACLLHPGGKSCSTDGGDSSSYE